MVLMVQNIPQFQNRYPDGVWEELIGGCDFRLFLGCNESTTAEYFSALTGLSTIEVETIRKIGCWSETGIHTGRNHAA